MDSNIYFRIFFTNVLRLLDEKNWTKEHLAEVSGVSLSFISNLTNGRGNPSLRIMEAIANALGQPLPMMLIDHDLNKSALDELTNGKWSKQLPEGHTAIFAILTEQKAFLVKKWSGETMTKLLSKLQDDM